MTVFAVNQPVATREPVVIVDAGLPVGTHRFQLVVQDDGGRSSVPVLVDVKVQRLLIDPVLPIPNPVPIRPLPIDPLRNPR